MKKKVENEDGALSGAPKEKSRADMSEAAKKAWQTRRNKYGEKGKKSRARKSVEKSGAESGAGRAPRRVDVGSAEYLGMEYEDFVKAYRGGFLQVKRNGNSRKGRAIKIDVKTREFLDFLYGRRWLKDVIFEKCWSMAKAVAKEEIWGDVEDVVDGLVIVGAESGAVVQA
jgi:hypothetical protein